MKFSFMLLVLALFAAGCVNSPQATPTATPAATPTAVPGANTIEITASGFSPNTLTIKQGETVAWVNKADAASWPASAMHPTHRVYPGSDIAKCGTAEQSNIFDACKDLMKGESWSFKFNEKGTWAYHDHSNPSQFGRVIVE